MTIKRIIALCQYVGYSVLLLPPKTWKLPYLYIYRQYCPWNFSEGYQKITISLPNMEGSGAVVDS